ncbi:hypothetical protein ACFX10_003209 [Malus domestica]
MLTRLEKQMLLRFMSLPLRVLSLPLRVLNSPLRSLKSRRVQRLQVTSADKSGKEDWPMVSEQAQLLRKLVPL